MTDATTTRQPIFNVPSVVLLLIVVMAGIEAAQSLLGDQAQADLLARLAFVPGRVTLSIDPAAVMSRLVDAMSQDAGPDGPAAVGQFFLGNGSLQPWTVLSYAFLHGGWAHLALNAVWLLAFATPVVRRIRAVRFLALFALSAIAGAAAHYAVDPLSLQPLVGASAAVSGCMGAAVRFIFAPLRPSRDPVAAAGHRAPRRSLVALATDRRAGAFLVVWFASNLVTGIGAVPLGLSDVPIAWQAHIGGFLLGLLAFPLFDPGGLLPPTDPDGSEPDEAA